MSKYVTKNNPECNIGVCKKDDLFICFLLYSWFFVLIYWFLMELDAIKLLLLGYKDREINVFWYKAP